MAARSPSCECSLCVVGKGFDEMNGDELDELEDDIDEEEERIFEMYRYANSDLPPRLMG